MPRLSREERRQEKELKRLQKQKKKEEKERRIALEQRRKELIKQAKENQRIQARRDRKKEKQEEEDQQIVWIDSTQMCVPVRDVIESIVVTADSRYLKIIEVKPNNFSALHVRKQNMISESFAQMLSIIPYQVQIKCFTRRADVERQITEMRQEFSHETNSVLAEMQEDYLQLVRRTASTIGVTRRFFVILQYRKTGQEKGRFDNIASGLEQTASLLKSNLRECECTVLDTGDTTAGVNSILYEVLNRKMSEDTLFDSHAEELIHSYMNSDAPLDKDGKPKKALVTANELIAPKWMDFTHANYCVVDEKYYRFYFIDSTGYKSPAVAGWLTMFIGYGAGVDVDIFIRHIEADAVQEKIARNQRLNLAKNNTSTNVDYYDMQGRTQSGQYMLAGIAGGQSYFEFCTLVTLTADSLDELNELNTYFTQAVKTNGIKLNSCMFQTEKAFYSALPLCSIDRFIWQKGWRNILTDGAASLYPFLSFELQDPRGIMMGTNNRNNSLVLVNLFASKLHPNANVSIIGKSGYGKTFTSQLIAIRERLQGVQVFIITPMSGKEDYYRICQKIQGQFVSMGTGTKNYINIFDIRAMDTTVDADGTVNSLLDQKIGTLHIFFGLIVKDLTLEENQVLDDYLYQVYMDRGITKDNNDSIYKEGTKEYKDFPLLEDVYELIKDVEELHRVANIIKPYVYGVHSEFNKHTNVNLENKYIVFDMDGLKGDDLALALFVCLDHVWSKIKENKAVKKAVFIDEIWKLIGLDGNDTAAEYCVEIYKTIRKYGGSACCMTQELTDFFKLKDGKYGKAIISNSDTKICLRVDDAEVEKLTDVMELSESEMNQIPKYPRGTGLLVTGDSRVEVKFVASPKEFNVITTDPEVHRREAAQKQARQLALQKLKEQENGKKNAEPDIEIL